METIRTKVIVSLHLCRSNQLTRRLLNLRVWSPSSHWSWNCTRGAFFSRSPVQEHNALQTWMCYCENKCVLLCCILTPVEKRGSQTQIPWAIFRAGGKYFHHPSFTWLPTNNCCSAAVLQASSFSLNWQAADVTHGETNQGDKKEQRVGKRQEVAPQGEANEAEVLSDTLDVSASFKVRVRRAFHSQHCMKNCVTSP